MQNAFTVDVEDYFKVAAFTDVVAMSSWERRESRVERNTMAVLDLLAVHRVRGTFFVLGWVARQFPRLVRTIAARGHEIASHGMNHEMVYQQTPDVFRAQTRAAKAMLEELVQRPVIGYRAATYSITRASLWALDVLAEEGFLYDSSIFPMHHDNYGIPDARREPHLLRTSHGNTIVEFPISVVRYGKLTLPVGGGGYFRIFPYALTRWGLRRLNAQQREFVFYIHPWEIDPEQPRIAQARLRSRLRHYFNLDRCRSRLERLLQDFAFVPVVELLRDRGLLAQGGSGDWRIAAERESPTRATA